MNPIIFVIVPVYNAENYVGKCIESIQSQIYPHWNMLLVDDGSTDASFEVCQKYASQDNRIRVVRQNNAGAGAARNTGIAMATGKYVVFVDSDDYLEKDYFSILSTHDEDLVFIDVQNVDEDGRVLLKDNMSINSSFPKDTILRRQMTGCINWGGVRKAIKTSILDKYNVKYTNHKIGEEALYSFQILWYAKSIGFISQPVYNYVQRNDSLSHSRVDDPWGGAAQVLKQKVVEMGLYENYATTVNAFLLTAAAVSAKCLASNYSYQQYLQKSRLCRNQLLLTLDSQHSIDKLNMSAKARIIGWLLLNKQYFAIWLLSKFRGLKK